MEGFDGSSTLEDSPRKEPIVTGDTLSFQTGHLSVKSRVSCFSSNSNTPALGVGEAKCQTANNAQEEIQRGRPRETFGENTWADCTEIYPNSNHSLEDTLHGSTSATIGERSSQSFLSHAATEEDSQRKVPRDRDLEASHLVNSQDSQINVHERALKKFAKICEDSAVVEPPTVPAKKNATSQESRIIGVKPDSNEVSVAAKTDVKKGSVLEDLGGKTIWNKAQDCENTRSDHIYLLDNLVAQFFTGIYKSESYESAVSKCKPDSQPNTRRADEHKPDKETKSSQKTDISNSTLSWQPGNRNIDNRELESATNIFTVLSKTRGKLHNAIPPKLRPNENVLPVLNSPEDLQQLRISYHENSQEYGGSTTACGSMNSTAAHQESPKNENANSVGVANRNDNSLEALKDSVMALSSSYLCEEKTPGHGSDKNFLTKAVSVKDVDSKEGRTDGAMLEKAGCLYKAVNEQFYDRNVNADPEYVKGTFVGKTMGKKDPIKREKEQKQKCRTGADDGPKIIRIYGSNTSKESSSLFIPRVVEQAKREGKIHTSSDSFNMDYKTLKRQRAASPPPKSNANSEQDNLVSCSCIFTKCLPSDTENTPTKHKGKTGGISAKNSAEEKSSESEDSRREKGRKPSTAVCLSRQNNRRTTRERKRQSPSSDQETDSDNELSRAGESKASGSATRKRRSERRRKPSASQFGNSADNKTRRTRHSCKEKKKKRKCPTGSSGSDSHGTRRKDKKYSKNRKIRRRSSSSEDSASTDENSSSSPACQRKDIDYTLRRLRQDAFHSEDCLGKVVGGKETCKCAEKKQQRHKNPEQNTRNSSSSPEQSPKKGKRRKSSKKKGRAKSGETNSGDKEKTCVTRSKSSVRDRDETTGHKKCKARCKDRAERRDTSEGEGASSKSRDRGEQTKIDSSRDRKRDTSKDVDTERDRKRDPSKDVDTERDRKRDTSKDVDTERDTEANSRDRRGRERQSERDISRGSRREEYDSNDRKKEGDKYLHNERDHSRDKDRGGKQIRQTKSNSKDNGGEREGASSRDRKTEGSNSRDRDHSRENEREKSRDQDRESETNSRNAEKRGRDRSRERERKPESSNSRSRDHSREKEREKPRDQDRGSETNCRDEKRGRDRSRERQRKTKSSDSREKDKQTERTDSTGRTRRTVKDESASRDGGLYKDNNRNRTIKKSSTDRETERTRERVRPRDRSGDAGHSDKVRKRDRSRYSEGENSEGETRKTRRDSEGENVKARNGDLQRYKEERKDSDRYIGRGKEKNEPEQRASSADSGNATNRESTIKDEEKSIATGKERINDKNEEGGHASEMKCRRRDKLGDEEPKTKRGNNKLTKAVERKEGGSTDADSEGSQGTACKKGRENAGEAHRSTLTGTGKSEVKKVQEHQKNSETESSENEHSNRCKNSQKPNTHPCVGEKKRSRTRSNSNGPSIAKNAAHETRKSSNFHNDPNRRTKAQAWSKWRVLRRFINEEIEAKRKSKLVVRTTCHTAARSNTPPLARRPPTNSRRKREAASKDEYNQENTKRKRFEEEENIMPYQGFVDSQVMSLFGFLTRGCVKGLYECPFFVEKKQEESASSVQCPGHEERTSRRWFLTEKQWITWSAKNEDESGEGGNLMLVWNAIPPWMGLTKPKSAADKYICNPIILQPVDKTPLNIESAGSPTGRDAATDHTSRSPSPQSPLTLHNHEKDTGSVMLSGLVETRTTYSMTTSLCFHYPDFDTRLNTKHAGPSLIYQEFQEDILKVNCSPERNDGDFVRLQIPMEGKTSNIEETSSSHLDTVFAAMTTASPAEEDVGKVYSVARVEHVIVTLPLGTETARTHAGEEICTTPEVVDNVATEHPGKTIASSVGTAETKIEQVSQEPSSAEHVDHENTELPSKTMASALRAVTNSYSSSEASPRARACEVNAKSSGAAAKQEEIPGRAVASDETTVASWKIKNRTESGVRPRTKLTTAACAPTNQEFSNISVNRQVSMVAPTDILADEEANNASRSTRKELPAPYLNLTIASTAEVPVSSSSAPCLVVGPMVEVLDVNGTKNATQVTSKLTSSSSSIDLASDSTILMMEQSVTQHINEISTAELFPTKTRSKSTQGFVPSKATSHKETETAVRLHTGKTVSTSNMTGKEQKPVATTTNIKTGGVSHGITRSRRPKRTISDTDGVTMATVNVSQKRRFRSGGVAPRSVPRARRSVSKRATTDRQPITTRDTTASTLVSTQTAAQELSPSTSGAKVSHSSTRQIVTEWRRNEDPRLCVDKDSIYLQNNLKRRSEKKTDAVTEGLPAGSGPHQPATGSLLGGGPMQSGTISTLTSTCNNTALMRSDMDSKTVSTKRLNAESAARGETLEPVSSNSTLSALLSTMTTSREMVLGSSSEGGCSSEKSRMRQVSVERHENQANPADISMNVPVREPLTGTTSNEHWYPAVNTATLNSDGPISPPPPPPPESDLSVCGAPVPIGQVLGHQETNMQDATNRTLTQTQMCYYPFAGQPLVNSGMSHAQTIPRTFQTNDALLYWQSYTTQDVDPAMSLQYQGMTGNTAGAAWGYPQISIPRDFSALGYYPPYEARYPYMEHQWPQMRQGPVERYEHRHSVSAPPYEHPMAPNPHINNLHRGERYRSSGPYHPSAGFWR